VMPEFEVPPSARGLSAVRWFMEDKNGNERPETTSELAARIRMQREKATLDETYGFGQWRRVGGIIYVHAGAGPVPGAPYSGESGSMGGSSGQQGAYSGERPSRSAAPSGPTPQQVLDDPHATVEQKDEALARLLQAQFNEEAEMEQHEPLQNVQALPIPSASPRQRSELHLPPVSAASMHEGHLRRGDIAPPNSAASAAMTIGQLLRAESEPLASGAGGAGAAAADDFTPPSGHHLSFSPQSAPSAAAAAAMVEAELHGLSDEDLARALQQQFDNEASAEQQALQRQRQQQLLRQQQQQQLQQQQQRAIARQAPRRAGAPSGASESEIAQLPSFVLPASSAYLSENCQICQERFAAGEHLRQMQCMHAYHRECIDPWLGINRTCPVCKMPLHHAG